MTLDEFVTALNTACDAFPRKLLADYDVKLITPTSELRLYAQLDDGEGSYCEVDLCPITIVIWHLEDWVGHPPNVADAAEAAESIGLDPEVVNHIINIADLIPNDEDPVLRGQLETALRKVHA